MIVFVGGIIGAGKSTVAKGLARHFGFPYYDVDEIKKRVFRKDPDYAKNIAEGIPFSDELRREVFRQVFDDLVATRLSWRMEGQPLAWEHQFAPRHGQPYVRLVVRCPTHANCVRHRDVTMSGRLGVQEAWGHLGVWRASGRAI